MNYFLIITTQLIQLKNIMTKKSMLTLGVGLSAVALAGAMSVHQASAFWGGGESATRPNFDPERHAQMEQIMESGDYNAWKAQVGDRPMASVISEENFSKFVEMWKAREAGDVEKVTQLREELGLPARGQFHKGDGQGEGRGRHRMMNTEQSNQS